MFHKLEEFYWPFAGALVAILTLSIAYEVYGKTHSNQEINAFTAGVVVGGLLGLILYSVIRFILERFPLKK